MHKRSTDELLKQLEQGKDLAPYLEENKGEFEKIPLCYALAELLDRYGLRKAPPPAWTRPTPTRSLTERRPLLPAISCWPSVWL